MEGNKNLIMHLPVEHHNRPVFRNMFNMIAMLNGMENEKEKIYLLELMA